jgi:DNA-binding transcriptional ArsR family regulator
VDLLRVVGEPHRRQILRLVWAEELPAGEIAAQLPVTFGAVSQHLAVLRDAGFVTMRRVGRRRLYRADTSALCDLAPLLETMWRIDLERLAQAAEREADTASERRSDTRG